MQRRHLIVHRADQVPTSDSASPLPKEIREPEVGRWIKAVKRFSHELHQQARNSTRVFDIMKFSATWAE
jgi:hypothetical protein